MLALDDFETTGLSGVRESNWLRTSVLNFSDVKRTEILKSEIFSLITHVIKDLRRSLEPAKYILFSYVCIKSELVELRGYKVVLVMSFIFDILLLSSSQ